MTRLSGKTLGDRLEERSSIREQTVEAFTSLGDDRLKLLERAKAPSAELSVHAEFELPTAADEVGIARRVECEAR